MTVYLFTDFGAADIYVGQLKAILQQQAPGITVIDLLHEAPAFNVRASAHLLAALAERIPSGSVTLAVVDPGVGGTRDAVAVKANGSWWVGPDNGLLSVWAARAKAVDCRRIIWRPSELSASFHGRDLFAPIAAAIACGDPLADKTELTARLCIDLGGGELGEIIYIDHYGNAYTGLRTNLVQNMQIVVAGHTIRHARIFSEVPEGTLFCYKNSLGLLEIAGNACSAAKKLELRIGQVVEITV